MLVLSWFFYSQLILAKNCSPEDIVDKACQYFKSQPAQLIETSHRTKFINPAHFEKFIESPQSIRQPSFVDVSRVKKKFDEIKAELIKKISNGIPYEKLSLVKKNMIDRIKIVEIADPEEIQKEQRLKCTSQKAGAYFNPNNSKIEICPLFYQYPSEALYFSLAHELSHSIDPCAMNSNLYKVTLSQVEMANSTDEENESSISLGMISLFVDDSDVIHMLDVGPNKIKIEEIFKDQGSKKPLASSIEANKYPYKDRFNCEKKSKTIESSKDDCSQDPQNEIMCDHFGAWVLNSMISEELTEKQKYSIIGGIFPDVCISVKDRKTSGPQYLQSRKRMTEIILQMPGMLEKFGCESPKVNKCFKDFANPRISITSPVKSIQEEDQR